MIAVLAILVSAVTGVALFLGAKHIVEVVLSVVADVITDEIDPPVPLALYRARCDEVTALTARVKRLEAELAAVEQGR